MTNDLAVRTGAAPAMEWNAEQRQLVRDMFAHGATDDEFAALVEVARQRNLNPFTRQCFFIKRYDSTKKREVWQCQVSIDGMRAIALRTGQYRGQDAPEFGPIVDGHPEWCKIAVWRKDSDRPTVCIVYFDEYAVTDRSGNLTKMWLEKPRVMSSKCCESLALRKSFPEDLSNLYTPEEMGSTEESVRDAVERRETPLEYQSATVDVERLDAPRAPARAAPRPAAQPPAPSLPAPQAAPPAHVEPSVEQALAFFATATGMDLCEAAEALPNFRLDASRAKVFPAYAARWAVLVAGYNDDEWEAARAEMRRSIPDPVAQMIDWTALDVVIEARESGAAGTETTTQSESERLSAQAAMGTTDEHGDWVSPPSVPDLNDPVGDPWDGNAPDPTDY